jgi:hypothetical protein
MKKSSKQAMLTTDSCLNKDGADQKSAEVWLAPPSTDNRRAPIVLPDLLTPPSNYYAMLELSYGTEMKDLKYNK